MADFQEQAMGLTGLTIDNSSTSPSRAEFSQFLTDGAREIINILPPDLLQYCAGVTRLDDSPTTLAISADLDFGKILYVTHSDGARHLPCRQIPAAFKELANDSTSLKYFGTDSDPVYWINGTEASDDNTTSATILEVFPTPTATKTAFIHHITYPAITHSQSSITNFPDSAEYLVVLYASMKSLLSAIGSLSIPPDAFGDATALTSDAQSLTGDQLGEDTEFKEFDMWFTALGEMIEDDEDIELAGAQIEKINSYVNTWNIQLQGNMAEMQQYMQLYQTLKADYVMGIQMLQSGGLPQPQQAQPQRARR